MPDTTANRYNAYFGFFILGLIVFVASLFIGALETLYAVLFFLAGLNMIFSTQQPKKDPLHSTATHYEVYSRDNIVNYILAAVIVVEIVVYLFIPISKPLLILAMWILNLFAYPRFMQYFSGRLGKRLVGSYLQEQLPELKREQIASAVLALNSQPEITAEALSAQFQFTAEQAARLIVLYRKYLELL